MIVCLCEGISDRDVRAAAGQGIRTATELRKHNGAGSGCGACRRDLRRLIDLHAPQAGETTESHPAPRTRSGTTTA